ncbi:nucleotidyltransferase family protein [methanotrophic endosymbiont of Bathymodiolus puteoserpentis (Logatchev)]|uniref:nucleotidyltransferase family protein n=1 Tax=methanotrophic endosymbiont of Bathymodiolus puteoserpentis (Logatchev) TaxID=343235 RepID=UPI0013CB90CB|nr:nucleotidyltransferase family protein [methanotrophic endosymbiont of Bathymodiolus puteoserpentis (Logatchev)]SHE23762.1 DNA polymerase beta-like domain [methanotrophic endosymbiont of Bathymodiolus puteoserpentis (Logatchev)]
MTREQALIRLTQLKPELIERFGVSSLALFGSTVRNEATPNSDIDILVDFNGPASSDRYFGLQFFLEDHLGVMVDLVTEKALRKELRPFIEQEAVNV